jgi:hypothetical protein
MMRVPSVSLVFNQQSQTANGLAREAPVTLREIRLEQLSIDNFPAAVNDNLTDSRGSIVAQRTAGIGAFRPVMAGSWFGRSYAGDRRGHEIGAIVAA